MKHKLPSYSLPAQHRTLFDWFPVEFMSEFEQENTVLSNRKL